MITTPFPLPKILRIPAYNSQLWVPASDTFIFPQWLICSKQMVPSQGPSPTSHKMADCRLPAILRCQLITPDRRSTHIPSQGKLHCALNLLRVLLSLPSGVSLGPGYMLIYSKGSEWTHRTSARCQRSNTDTSRQTRHKPWWRQNTAKKSIWFWLGTGLPNFGKPSIYFDQWSISKWLELFHYISKLDKNGTFF